MEYDIISITRKHFLSSIGHSERSARQRIDSGEVWRHLMPEYKQDEFLAVPSGVRFNGKNEEEVRTAALQGTQKEPIPYTPPARNPYAILP